MYNRLSNYATTVAGDGDTVRVTYHSTVIVEWNADTIILYHGGWPTATTKKKMNQAANQFRLDYHVYQKDYEWFVDYKGEAIPFENELAILTR